MMSDKYTLTILDTRGIQDYIFGTNHLRQNLGASYLVNCATRTWLKEALEEENLRHNITNLDAEEVSKAFSSATVAGGTADAEVIYAGGGNALVIFANHVLAVQFTNKLTSRILREAPGLGVVVSHLDFNWSTEPLGGDNGILKRAFEALAIRKDSMTTSLPRLGLSVTAQCVFTGQPAVGIDKDGRLISSESSAKIRASDDATKQLTEKLLDPHQQEQYLFPADFDHLGATHGESSYIAVIHTDGNRMAIRSGAITKQFGTASQNADCVKAMREFSISIQRAAMNALRSTVNRLIDSIKEDEERDEETGEIVKRVGKSAVQLHAEEIENKPTGKYHLPFRPIVFGGDDVTFVCEGRLGLSLTSYYLGKLSERKLSDNGPAHGRAGIAVVKAHYPFARAYSLAEDLCKSAKAFINGREMTAMDWHFAASGQVLSLKKIREREYHGQDGNLYMRPVRLSPVDGDWRSWDTLRQLVNGFQNDREWNGKHNKVMKLREVLRDGKNAVQNFRNVYRVSLPDAPGLNAQDGWVEQLCPYYDAIEVMDFLVDIAEDHNAETKTRSAKDE